LSFIFIIDKNNILYLIRIYKFTMCTLYYYKYNHNHNCYKFKNRLLKNDWDNTEIAPIVSAPANDKSTNRPGLKTKGKLIVNGIRYNNCTHLGVNIYSRAWEMTQ